MRKQFITLSILLVSLLAIQACSPSSNIDDTFVDVEKITFEKLNLDGSKDLLFEMGEQEQITKVANCVDLNTNGTSGCDFTVLMTFHKPNAKIQGYCNFADDCKSMSYTYNSNFYTKAFTNEGAKYLRVLTGF
jgi:hypothetical protein